MLEERVGIPLHWKRFRAQVADRILDHQGPVHQRDGTQQPIVPRLAAIGAGEHDPVGLLLQLPAHRFGHRDGLGAETTGTAADADDQAGAIGVLGQPQSGLLVGGPEHLGQTLAVEGARFRGRPFRAAEQLTLLVSDLPDIPAATIPGAMGGVVGGGIEHGHGEMVVGDGQHGGQSERRRWNASAVR